jgi:4-aminobutyrate aminotransferase
MSGLPASRQEWDAVIRETAAEALLARDAAAFLHQRGSTPCLSAIRRAEGIWIEDLSGRRYMDFHGNSVHHIGYGHPRLKAALKAQIDELSFTPRRYTSEPAVALAERLAARSPHTSAKVLFAPSGSDAVEIALKLARIKTGRYKTIGFWESYHGHGYGAVSAAGTGTDRTHRIGPLLPGGLLVPPFACHACPYGFPADARGGPRLDVCGMLCASILRYAMEREGDVAAVIAEPVRATPAIPPPGFWAEVRRACDEHGAMLIFDEIPTGLGKTGRLFSSEHAAVRPDITVLGKALGGGMLPLAAVIADASFDLAPELALGHYTHEKNPLSACAGLTTLAIIEEEGLVEHARELGSRTLERLWEMVPRLAPLAGARGAGLLIAVDLVDADRRPAPDLAERAMWCALALGLSLKASDASLILSPPLVITEAEMVSALDILERAIRAAAES